jgi:hypothetical protein
MGLVIPIANSGNTAIMANTARHLSLKCNA